MSFSKKIGGRSAFKRPSVIIFMLAVSCLLLLPLISAAALNSSGGTWVINIEGEIDPGQVLFVQRAYTEAVTAGAETIVFQIDTYGGYLDDAIKIKDIIMESQIHAVCYVNKKALSAGALLAMAGEKLAMYPGTTIGAAEPRIGNEIADEKVLSMWTTQLASVAEARQRNPQVAAAMSDSSIAIEGLVESGRLLTLTDTSALAWNISDATAQSLSAVCAAFDLPPVSNTLVPTFQEQVAKALSSPYVAAILLMVGLAGIVIEIFTAGGFGIFGAVGIVSLSLYFAGNIWAGSAGLATVLIFVSGLILIILEIFVIPGFGVPGILGVLSIIGSIIWASPSPSYAATSLLIALIGMIALVWLSFKFRPTRKAWSRLVLSIKQENKEGYVAPSAKLEELTGKQGIAVTTLRPAGTAVIDNERIDVVTDGEYIETNANIEVLRVEGTRVIVRKVKSSIANNISEIKD